MGSATSPDRWLTQAVTRLVLDAPENRLSDFGGQTIFDEPVVGVADGDDPLFERFRAVVSPDHLRPRELLEGCGRAVCGPRDSDAGQRRPAHVRVVAWVLPFTEPVRSSNRIDGWPSRLYSAARNNGGALNFAVRQRLTDLLRQRGAAAIAPALSDGYEAYRCDVHTFSSTWSERHAAYAAGLGLFGLSAALITPVGVNVRIGSIVTSLPLRVTPRQGTDYRAPCLARGGDGCGACIARCPVGAISPAGLDKTKCNAMRKAVRERCLDDYARTLHLLPALIAKRGDRRPGYSLGCALCQCGVPCEGGYPTLPCGGGPGGQRCLTSS